MANISEEKWIEMLEKKADGTYIAKYPKVKSKSGVTFDEHLADDVSQGEIHGLRVNNEKLEYYTGVEWKIASGGIPVGNVSGLSVEEGNAEITLRWTDPEDRYLDDLKIAEWQGTKIIRKEGSYPISDDDGVLVVDNKTRNQYSSNGYKDTGLTNGTTYYYMAFPYTEDAITVDSANRISATPQAYDDLTGSPGPKNLIAGTMQAGFFGEVSAEQLISGNDLALMVGISVGTGQHSDIGWLKFSFQGKIQFVAKKTLRHSISWDHINTAGCALGTKTIEIGGLTYKVRLLRTSTANPTGIGAALHGGEWNRLILPIHERAIDKSWAYPDNVENDIPVWVHSLGTGAQGMYTDEDLLTHNSHGSGSYSWCQETSSSNSANRLYRGRRGVSYANTNTPSNTYSSDIGWRPVLELV